MPHPRRTFRPSEPFASVLAAAAAFLSVTAGAGRVRAEEGRPLQISGRYPHLAMFNHQGECGTGAVVPWADRLWVITYAPHLPTGSDDKLYEIDGALARVTRPESVGGTPADRMIHRESKQLVIGPYFIDAGRNVRVITPKQMPGRLTAVARHLTDPARRIYVYDMEGALYDVDVHSLGVTKLFARAAPGAHGKGGYAAQGRLVVSNNGASVVNKAPPAADDAGYAQDPEAAGALTEWDGQAWTVLERRQFTEVTGPGGVEGAPADDAPLWALGWDKRSVILKLLDHGRWHDYRLPKADYSYDGKHGWHTEWPRIREVVTAKGDAPARLLMNMHGGWFDFPKTFSAADTSGLRPIGSHLKITGDFCAWDGRLVFGCDDASLTSNNPLASQSQSNLWFTSWDGLRQCGRPAGAGGPWVHDAVKAGEPSAPFLVGGYARRVLHLAHEGDAPVTFALEIDADGKGQWAKYQSLSAPARGYAWHVFPDDLRAQWVRVTADRDCAKATAFFDLGPGGGATAADPALFAALADVGAHAPACEGVVRPRGHDLGTLQFAARTTDAAGKSGPSRWLEVRADLRFRPLDGEPEKDPAAKDAGGEVDVAGDEASVIVTQGKVRYRLPRSDPAYGPTAAGAPDPAARAVREVATERCLINAGGSFYVLPRAISGGAARLKVVCSHNKRISDFCSWRGLLVLAGTRADAEPDGHYFPAAPTTAAADDGPAAGLWFGDIDDLWKLGKPAGRGGPWLGTPVEPGRPSDPYLMAGYDRKTIELSHDAPAAVRFTIEVDFLADGAWRPFRTVEAAAGQTARYEFPAGYSAHWVRVRCDTPCKATAQLAYE